MLHSAPCAAWRLKFKWPNFQQLFDTFNACGRFPAQKLCATAHTVRHITSKISGQHPTQGLCVTALLHIQSKWATPPPKYCVPQHTQYATARSNQVASPLRKACAPLAFSNQVDNSPTRSLYAQALQHIQCTWAIHPLQEYCAPQHTPFTRARSNQVGNSTT